MLHFLRLMISLLLFISIVSFAKSGALLNESEPKIIKKPVQITVAELPVYFSPYSKTPLAQQYLHLFFDSLLGWDDKGELEGRLLTSWQEVKPGVMRFNLKKDIHFHSGNPLTSRDITWTYNENIKKQHSFSFLQQIQSVTAIDEYSFEIHSDLREAQVLDYLTLFFVLDSTFYKQHKIDQNTQLNILRAPISTMPISGTGPYLIKEYNPALHLQVESNRDYWEGTPSIPELRFIKVKSAKSRLFALLINDVDISTNIPSNKIASVDIMSSKSLVEVSSENVILLTINDKKSPIFANKKARNALILAINQQGKIKTIASGMGEVEHTFIPVQKHYEVLMNSQLVDYDLKKSRQRIKNLQIPKQLTLLAVKDQTGKKQQIINALTNMMKKVGIQLIYTEVLTLEEWNKYQSDYDLSISIWKSDFRNTHNMYNDLFNDRYLSGFINSLVERKKINHSLTQQAMFFDAAQREHYITPLFFQNNIWAADNKFNLADIFSVTGVPYWQKLKINNITD
jgi:peptide/nickel transport system substrate-binding protein